MAGQDSFLVTMHVAFLYRQVGSLLADGRAIVIRHNSAGEFDIFHRRIVARDHPNRFAAGAPVLGRPLTPTVRSFVVQPHTSPAVVAGRVDLDGASVRRGSHGAARHFVRQTRPDAEHRGAGGGR